MIYLSWYGREVFWILAILFLFIFGRKTGRKTAFVMFISMIVLIPIGIITKEIIERPRPVIPESDFLITAGSEYSYPSGHALIVSAGATVALVLMRGSSIQFLVALLLTTEAASVCFSRVYVGVIIHWMSWAEYSLGLEYLLLSYGKRKNWKQNIFK